MNERLKEIQQEVDEMNKAFDAQVLGSPEPDSSFEPEPEPEPEPELEPEPEPQEELDETEDEEEELEQAQEAEPEPEPEPADDTKIERSEQSDLITELKSLVEEVKKAKPPATSPPAPATEPPQDFVGDLDAFEAEDLNKILNNAVRAARSQQQAIDMDKLNELINVQVSMRESANKFYSDNKDLNTHRETVSTVFAELAEKSPEKSFTELVSVLAPEVRKRLNLPTPKPSEDEPTAPRLPRKKGKPARAKEEPKPDPLQSEFEEMNKALGR